MADGDTVLAVTIVGVVALMVSLGFLAYMTSMGQNQPQGGGTTIVQPTKDGGWIIIDKPGVRVAE